MLWFLNRLEARWLMGVAMVSASASAVAEPPVPPPEARSPGASFAVQQVPEAGRKGTAQRRRFCASYQCAFAGDKVWCMQRCVNVWDFPSGGRPSNPIPGTDQRVYQFTGGLDDRGIIGTVRLQPGKRVFRATHAGTSNFILYVTSTAPDSAPDVAFNEQGRGTWTWTFPVERAGNYTLDLKFADARWTLTIE